MPAGQSTHVLHQLPLCPPGTGNCPSPVYPPALPTHTSAPTALIQPAQPPTHPLLSGSSSGLHHDFHDNLYILLRGSKRFRLFPPSSAPDMYVTGNIRHIYPNGRIVYDGQGDIQADGSSESRGRGGGGRGGWGRRWGRGWGRGD